MTEALLSGRNLNIIKQMVLPISEQATIIQEYIEPYLKDSVKISNTQVGFEICKKYIELLLYRHSKWVKNKTYITDVIKEYIKEECQITQYFLNDSQVDPRALRIRGMIHYKTVSELETRSNPVLSYLVEQTLLILHVLNSLIKEFTQNDPWMTYSVQCFKHSVIISKVQDFRIIEWEKNFGKNYD